MPAAFQRRLGDPLVHVVQASQDIARTGSAFSGYRFPDDVIALADGHVPDDVYGEAARQFEPRELALLIWQITIINAWNRVAISTRMVPGVVPAGGPLTSEPAKGRRAVIAALVDDSPATRPVAIDIALSVRD
jgi:hypothetical protein